jgi:hypothetical protein
MFVVANILISFDPNFTFYTIVDRLRNEYNYYFRDELASLILILVIAPIFEEFYFRFLLLNLFKQIDNSDEYILTGTTIIFIIIHFPFNIFEYNIFYSLRDIFIIIEIGMASVLFGLLYLKTRSLLYPIFAHFLWNLSDLIFLNFSFYVFNYRMGFLFPLFIMLIVISFLFGQKKLYWKSYLDQIIKVINKKSVIFVCFFSFFIILLFKIHFFLLY